MRTPRRRFKKSSTTIAQKELSFLHGTYKIKKIVCCSLVSPCGAGGEVYQKAFP